MSYRVDFTDRESFSDNRQYVYAENYWRYGPVTARRPRRFERATEYADRLFLGCCGGALFAVLVNIIVSIG